MPVSSLTTKNVELNIVGSSIFGRDPKISDEHTVNMMITDNMLIPTPGYVHKIVLSSNGAGRGFFNSSTLNQMVAVVFNEVYLINKNLSYSLIGTLDTFQGDVFINENNNKQILISDQSYLYEYNFGASPGFTKKTSGEVPFTPGFITFQNSRFVVASLGTNQWQLSGENTTTFANNQTSVGQLQTKPDHVKAVLRVPGGGNQLLVFGSHVAELWTDMGSPTFPYQRNTSINIDYGIFNAATLAANDKYIVWLGGNEQTGPVIMASNGGNVKSISTDGINYLFSKLTDPFDSYGFLYQIYGHQLYQLTFPTDNISLLYDFTLDKFFELTDNHANYHIAKSVIFFNGDYYFISFNDGKIYELATEFYTYDSAEIPRTRICRNIRFPDTNPMIVNSLSFLIAQGDSSETQRVDLSVSKDGGQSFSNTVGKELNNLGHRPNRLYFRNLGRANDFVAQLKFWGKTNFVVGDGMVELYR